MHFICRSFLGKPRDNNWSQYWENEPDDPILKSTKGHLFGLINLSTIDVDDIKSLGHDIIYEINQSYFSTDSSDVTANLKNTLKSLSQNPLYQSYGLKITLLLILDSQIFIAVFGDHQVFINRQDKISCLLSGQDHQVNSICGPTQSEDKIFIITSEFLEIIKLNNLKNILADQKIQNIEENLLSLLYSSGDQPTSSAVLVEIINQDNPIVSESEIISPSLAPDKPVFVNHQQSTQMGKRKKIQIFIALILLFGLFVSSYFGFRKNQKAKIESQYQSLKTEIEKQINNISVIKKLNLTDAQNQAQETQKLVQNLIGLKVHSDEVSQLRSQIDSLLSQTGVSDSFTPILVYDTSLITAHPQYTQFFLNSQNLYLLDTTQGRIDVLNITDKSNKNISISDKIKSAKKIVADQNNTFLLLSDGIYSVGKTDLTSKINFSQSSPSPNPVDFKLWNGSIYALDPNQTTVWKFAPTSSGFSVPQNWLKNDLKIDSTNTSLAIDGKVWLLSPTGQISVFISGIKDNFKNPQNLSFTSTTSLSLNDKSDVIAFLDNQNFVYVYKKDGELVSKYNLNKLKVIDLALDGANKIIYLLSTDQKIYKITL